MRVGSIVLLACCGLAAAPARAADDAVIVIRGADVSVARPITAERALDGSAEVEIVRVEPGAPPAPEPKAPAVEREIIVVYVPTVEVAAPVGVPVGWWPARAHERHARGRHVHFAPGVRPFATHLPALRRNLRGR